MVLEKCKSDDLKNKFLEAMGILKHANELCRSSNANPNCDAFLRIHCFEKLIQCTLIIFNVESDQNASADIQWKSIPLNIRRSIFESTKQKITKVGSNNQWEEIELPDENSKIYYFPDEFNCLIDSLMGYIEGYIP